MLHPSEVSKELQNIFQELISLHYHLTPNIKQRMKYYLNTCKIQIDFSCNSESDYVYNTTQNIAHISENLKLDDQGNMSVQPCLYIKEFPKQDWQSVLCHEALHLFSMGECEITFQSNSKIFLYQSGIEQYIVHKSGKIERINQYAFLNEILNDYAASYVYHRLYKREYQSNPQFSCLQMANYFDTLLEHKKFLPAQLIAAYLSHHNKQLQNILQVDQFTDLQFMEDALYHCYKQNTTFQIS